MQDAAAESSYKLARIVLQCPLDGHLDMIKDIGT